MRSPRIRIRELANDQLISMLADVLATPRPREHDLRLAIEAMSELQRRLVEEHGIECTCSWCCEGFFDATDQGPF